MQGINPSNYERSAPFPQGSKPGEDFLIHLVVETPQGIRHKYAFDKESGLFKLRATIPEGLTWPYDYGFVPGTLGDDGDPLDVLFLCEENDRLLAIAKPMKGVAQTTDQYDKAVLVEYSEDAGNTIEFKGVEGRRKALDAVRTGIEAFEKKRNAG